MTTSEKNREIASRLSNSLARVIREIDKDFERRIYAELAKRGYPDVRASHGAVFSNLGMGAVRVTELAERAQVTQQAMGKMLKELEQMGYVTRAVDQGDKRAKEIQLTERGIELALASVEAFETAYRFYESRIGSAELEELEFKLRSAARKLRLDYLPDGWADQPSS